MRFYCSGGPPWTPQLEQHETLTKVTTTRAASTDVYKVMITTISNDEQQELINRVAVLARENFALRAAEYDRTATFPFEDFDDCFAPDCSRP